MLPLLLVELLWRLSVAELVLFIVGLDKVVDDGTRLPQGDASVGILDDGGSC